jgi:ubiquinone biosynthesis monooxygenase Coq7
MQNNRLPGDADNTKYISQTIRVNHAGEYGAKRIYLGQLSVLKNDPEIQHMLEQELEHLEYFEGELVKRHIRPSIFFPLWHVGGFMLGKITALMGRKAAMACTEAVEEVIDKHYQQQIETLDSSEIELTKKCIKFREDEIEHKKAAINSGSQHTPFHFALTSSIKLISSLAINLAKKL